MKSTVIIPNYNGMRFLKTCLDSLNEQSEKDFRLIVIDNASTDGSVSYIRDNYPKAEVFINQKNEGFTGAVNKGISLSGSEYVILLNNDTQVDRNFVSELEKIMDSSKKIFSASSMMVNYNRRDIIDDAGDIVSIIGWPFQRGVGHAVDEYTKKTDVFSACAGAAIYRKSVLDKIGCFDPMHFAYLEDIDLGFRARLHGYHNVYCPGAVCYHVGSGTTGSKYNDFKVKLAARNQIYLFYKNMPDAMCFVNAPFLFAGIAIKYLFFKKRGFSKAYIEGVKEGIATRDNCKRTDFKTVPLRIFFDIEFRLIKGMIIYVKEYYGRKDRWQKV